LFGASLLLFWVAAGQRLDSLLPFIGSSLRLSSGWTEALSLSNPGEAQAVGWFLFVAALPLGLIAYTAWVRHRLFGLGPLGAFGGLLFLIFKYGYVRRDGHDLAAANVLLLLSLLASAVGWSAFEARGRWAGRASFLPVIAALVLSLALAGQYPNLPGLLMVSRYPGEGFLSRLFQTLDEGTLRTPQQLFRGKELRAAYEENGAEIRKRYPLPKIEGTVDVYPAFQMVVAAHGLRYHPRPVIQSNLASTPELAELNAAHLRGDGAPDSILFTFAPIDNRFPSLEDGLSWPELLTRYDIKNATDTFLVLKRTPAPRAYRLTALKEITFRLGEPVAIPQIADGPIWARLEVNRTLLGDIATTLYKPPILSLKVNVAGGEARFWLSPGMARDGFLLSPVVPDSTAFAALASSDWQHRLAGGAVSSITVLVENESGTTGCYRSTMRLSLYRLELAR